MTNSAAPPSNFASLCVTSVDPISDGYYRPALCPLPQQCRGPLQHRLSCPRRRSARRLSQQLVCLSASRSALAYRFVRGNCRLCGPSPLASGRLRSPRRGHRFHPDSNACLSFELAANDSRSRAEIAFKLPKPENVNSVHPVRSRKWTSHFCLKLNKK